MCKDLLCDRCCAGCRFALKSFSKVKVLQAGSAQDVLDELVVMAQLQSPFCCRLIQRFHDANCV